MVRKTSIQAYDKIKENGLLGRMQFQAYHHLYLHGPMTAMELKAMMGFKKADSQVRARLNELRTLGVVQEIGKKKCSVTGNVVILWDVNDCVPNRANPAYAHRTKCESCSGRGYL